MDTPANYICSKCGASGCKLWRPYQTSHVTLLCATCAGDEEGKDVSQIDEAGTLPSKFSDLHRVDQIGWYVPAVPTGDTYWGYGSVPDEGVKWWKELPTLPLKA